MSPRVMMLVVCTAAAGCSLLTPLDELTRGNGTTPDTTTDGGGDAAPADATSDVRVDDAGTLDTGTPLFRCATLMPAPTICEDFDSDGSITPPWFADSSGVGSKVAVSSSAFLSSPKSLVASVPPGNVARSAYYGRTLPIAATRARLAYALRIDEPPATGEIEVNLLRFSAETTLFDYYLAISSAGAKYVQQLITEPETFNTDVALSRPIPVGAWTRVTIDVDLTSASFTVTIDGVPAASTTLAYPPKNTVSLGVNAGITFAGDTAGKASVAIDDLVFELTP